MDNLVVLNNEKISEKNEKFFCRNFNFKILPEGLNRFFNVQYIARKSKIDEHHELDLKNVKIASNIIQFIYYVLSTFKNKNTKYYIITITPYTFLAFLFLVLFRKKVFVYLISSGYEEWKFIIGSWSVWIYHLMYSIVTSKATVIALHERLYKKDDGHIIESSTLNQEWLQDLKKPDLSKVKFLNVSRVNPEKGIFEFLEMFKKLKMDVEISIIGKVKNLTLQSKFQSIIENNSNILFPGYISDRKELMNAYDNHNILILPSYTEGQPYVVDESLARRRPVLIFKDIKHIIKGRKGIFVCERNIDSLAKTIKFIIQNYPDIQKEIDKNKFPLEEDMFKQISNVIKNN
ncbi:glycosyltransferase [Candidatus Pelagibacter bacterium]|jgi:glycosyltransferase involved in cell wall biosynthesis|nr:glycosyltransferase [Candidatus Pelagibacter bacterium]